MKNVYLVSEDTIKSNSELNDNIFGKTLGPAIRNAQEEKLLPIIGEALYDAILSKVADASIASTANTQYKALLDNWIQPFLIEEVLAEIIPILASKMGNLGVVHSKDEYVETLSSDEVERFRKYHQNRADFRCGRLQRYILDNRKLFKELDDNTCHQIKSSLHSAASTSLWLGGYRARK